MTSPAHASAILLPQRCRPYSGWADGLSGAYNGRPQYPNLLNGYCVRPPWNVAGVDYPVGIPPGTVMKDWRTVNDPAITPNPTTGFMRLDGIAGGNVTLRNIDFSLGIGAVIYNASGGAASITCINCKFALPATSSQQYGVVAPIHDQNAAVIVVQNCFFDGKNMGASTFLSVQGTTTMQYNWFINAWQHILEFNSTTNATLTYKYNLIDVAAIGPGAHMNFLQGGSAGSPKYFVSFNTNFQQTPGGAEGWQFEAGATGAIAFDNPQFTNNVSISRKVAAATDSSGTPRLGPNSMSYHIHGVSSPDSVVGTGINNNNYFDLSGAYNAYYPGTMTPAKGWSSSGNIDMNTGAAITPA